MKKYAQVSIVGRVNTGKSTLFNRLIKKPLAITDSKPGLTRDRIKKLVSYAEIPFYLTDTGGLYPPEEDLIWEKVKEKIERTVEESDLILFVVDASTGLLPHDEEIAEWLRKKGKDVILVANKVDIKKKDIYSFFSLGFGDPIGVSSAHGTGLSDLLELIEKKLREKGFSEEVKGEKTEKTRIAILGKPNVGKSSLFNTLCGEEINIVSEIPGTTRDAVDVETDEFIFVDTAGIRKKYSDPIELFGAVRSERSLRFAEVAILVIDASTEITSIDKKIANLIVEENRGIVVALNKCDLIPREKRAAVLNYFKRELDFISFAPLLFTSTVTGEGIGLLKEVVKQAKKSWERKLGKRELLQFHHFLQKNFPFSKTIIKISQEDIRPPKFKILTDARLKSNELRYIENKLRENFAFYGTPLILENEYPTTKQ
ncbi:MAG: ribosome biogenesis GTPase Der [bacterium]|nr:ribosome biogenesis GTPase Der [bacterium]